MTRAESSDQGVTNDPPLAPWEAVVVWVALSAATLGWLPLYALLWTLIERAMDGLGVVFAWGQERRVERSCRRGEASRSGH